MAMIRARNEIMAGFARINDLRQKMTAEIQKIAKGLNRDRVICQGVNAVFPTTPGPGCRASAQWGQAGQERAVSGEFAIADHIGAFRVWMDAGGVDVLVLDGSPWPAGPEMQSVLTVIDAGAIGQMFDWATLCGYLRRVLKPGQVLAAVGVNAPLQALACGAKAVYRVLGQAELADLDAATGDACVNRSGLHQ